MEPLETRTGHDLKFCKLPNCANELQGDEPSRGIWANICQPCRRGETVPGTLYREQRGFGGSGSVGQRVAPQPQPEAEGASIEAKAKAVVPLARVLERKVVASKAARREAAGAVEEFTNALKELRDAARALIGDPGGE